MNTSVLKSVLAVIAVVVIGLNSLSAQADGHGGYAHHVVFHVDENDKARMNLVLNNAANVIKYYEGKGQKVEIEVVAYGPGLHMLRADSSPVAARLETFAMEYDNIAFAACGNTVAGMTKKEGKAPQLLDLGNVRVVPSGVVQLIERQGEGWKYIRP